MKVIGKTKGFSNNWNRRHSKTIKKTRYISSASLFDKSNKIEQPKEINVISDSPSVSGISRHVSSITTVSPDKERIPCKIKRKKMPDILIKGKDSIQEPENPSKRAKVDSIIDEKIYNNNKTSTI